MGHIPIGKFGKFHSALAILLTVALSFASVIGMGVSASLAAVPGISTSVSLGSTSHNGTPVVAEGQTLTMKVQYDGTKVEPGSTLRIELGANVSLGAVPPGNSAITKIEKDPADPNAVLLTFADPWPAGVGQGVFDLSFTVNKVENSAKEKISWKVDGEETSLDVIVKNDGDQFASVNDHSSKFISNSGNLSQFVKYDKATQKVTLDPSVIGAPVEYTLTVDTSAPRDGYLIADELPKTMAYNEGSFTATQISWDDEGLNRTESTVPFTPSVSGNSFTGFLDLPGPSKTVIKYKAAVADEAARLALEAELQAQIDAIDKDNGGTYSVALKNSATLGKTPPRSNYNFGRHGHR